MAKFEIKIKADLDHLMEYVQNSLNPDFLPITPIETIEKEYDDVKIIFNRYSANTGNVMAIYTVKKGEDEICVEILNAGHFTQKWVYEDGGDKYMQYLADVFAAYDPDKTGKENIYIHPDFTKKLEKDIASGNRSASYGKAPLGLSILKFFRK